MSNRFVMLLCSTSSNLFRVDTTAANIILAITSFLFSVGFILGTPNTNNYTAIVSFASVYIWSLFFFIHSIEKGLEEFYPIPLFVRVLNSLFGMWLWNYVLLSFLVFDQGKTHPAEYILVAPIIIEVWYLTSLIYLADIQRGK